MPNGLNEFATFCLNIGLNVKKTAIFVGFPTWSDGQTRQDIVDVVVMSHLLLSFLLNFDIVVAVIVVIVVAALSMSISISPADCKYIVKIVTTQVAS